MWIFSGLVQSVVVTGLNLRTLPGRLAASTVAVVGMAGVVGVLVSVLSIAEGIRATMSNTGSPDSAIILRTGSDAEMTSILMQDDLDAIKDAPGIARRPGVGALASAELFVVVDLVKASTGTTANAPLRGVEPAAFAVRKFKMIKGRRFEPGRNEVIVGRAASAEDPAASTSGPSSSSGRTVGASSASSTPAGRCPTRSCGATPACSRRCTAGEAAGRRSTCA